MEKECEIIKDLLPSYVENLSSNQTKEIIHNHVENCENCKQILEMLQKNNNNMKKRKKMEEEHEVDSLKKYRKKMLKLRSITILLLLIIMTVFIGIIIKYVYNNCILKRSFNTIQDLKKAENYSLNIEEYEINYSTEAQRYHSTKIYYKDGNYKKENSSYITNNELVNPNYIFYGSINSDKLVKVYEDTKTAVIDTNTLNRIEPYTVEMKENEFEGFYEYTNTYGRDFGIINNLISKTTIEARTEVYKERNCNVLRIQHNSTGYTEIWIDKENSYVLKERSEIFGKYFYEKIFTLNIGNVMEEDVEIPDLDSYQVRGNNK